MTEDTEYAKPALLAEIDMKTMRPEPTNVSDVVGKITKAMEWQAIETAPKDGTPVLAYGLEPVRDPRISVRETRWEFYGEGSIAHADYKSGKGPSGAWGWHEPIHNWGSSWKPTHWMPLPPEPSETDDNIRTLLSALADAERERDEERAHRVKLQAALSFWMPGVSEAIEVELNGRAGDDAQLLAGFDGDVPAECWGDKALSTLSSQASLLEEARRVIELADALANQVRAVLFHLNGQAYSSTISAMNAFDAASLRLSKLGASNDA